jgi:hypothetical protein
MARSPWSITKAWKTLPFYNPVGRHQGRLPAAILLSLWIHHAEHLWLFYAQLRSSWTSFPRLCQLTSSGRLLTSSGRLLTSIDIIWTSVDVSWCHLDVSWHPGCLLTSVDVIWVSVDISWCHLDVSWRQLISSGRQSTSSGCLLTSSGREFYVEPRIMLETLFVLFVVRCICFNSDRTCRSHFSSNLQSWN